MFHSRHPPLVLITQIPSPLIQTFNPATPHNSLHNQNPRQFRRMSERKDDATHQVPRHLAAVHLVEHLLDGRLREPLGALVRRAHLLLEPFDERRLLVLRPPPFGLEVEPEAQDRVVQLLHPWPSDFFDRTRRKPSS